MSTPDIPEPAILEPSILELGILETGSPPKRFDGRFGSYGRMFEDLLGPSYAYRTFDVRSGELPDEATRCDAYLITGSAAGVYDADEWIARLKGFVQEASGRVPMIGVCFGHQLMAEAYGGRVIQSPKGWGIGVHTYQVQQREPWMDASPSVAAPVSHQDQVVELPAGAQVLAGSEFTPYGVVAYPERRAISVQFHPEFAPEYAHALIDLRRGTLFSDSLADTAIASLRGPNDRERVAEWFRRFLRSAA
jgi:GMP synthase-like glutamine amidotransferase